jgi:hypothetical protein
MNVRGLTVMTAVGLVTLPALAGATPSLKATGVQVGNHRGYVNVVVDFNGKVTAGQVGFDRLTRTTATVHIAHPGVTARVAGATGHGVRVALQPGTQALHIAASFAPHRFKYVSYTVLGGNRLAIDLWKTTPPRRAGVIHTCRGLTLMGFWSSNGLTQTVSVSGHEHGIFENQFQLVVRGFSGAVVGRKTVHAPGKWAKWAAKVHYHVKFNQPGTVEAVAFSAKDGALECLAQKNVELAAS